MAVKRLTQSDELAQSYGTTTQAQFDAEIKVLAHFQHPRLVQLLGCCTAKPFCLVYQFMEGGFLARRLVSDDPFTLRQRLVVANQVAGGLAYLHLEVRRVHRDIKPDNILLDEHGCARLGDFGLARSVPDGRVGTKTSGVAKGTPCYMAPEYIASPKVTFAIDVFSFGVVLLELISGQLSSSRINEPVYARHDELVAALQDGNDPAPDLWRQFLLQPLRAENESICKEFSNFAAECVHIARRRPEIKSDAPRRSVVDRLQALLVRMPLEKPACSFCLTNPPGVAMVPCGHVCLCTTCSPQVLRERCLICEQPVAHRVVLRP